MKALRPSDAPFRDLPDFPFAPHYAEIGYGLRVHYVDEGPRDAPVVLMLHGEPTWSYLYRHMIGPVAAAGFRAVAPDLIGFGRSDKPVARGDYSYAAQVGWMRAWIETLDLNRIVLVCQDWGSLIGLRLVAAMPDRFAGVVLSNGGLPEGQPAPTAIKLYGATDIRFRNDIARIAHFQRHRVAALAGFFLGLGREEFPVTHPIEHDLGTNVMLRRQLVDMARRRRIRNVHPRLRIVVGRPDTVEGAAAAIGDPQAGILPVPALAWVGVGAVIGIIGIEAAAIGKVGAAPDPGRRRQHGVAIRQRRGE
eukprot:gene1641-2210_t